MFENKVPLEGFYFWERNSFYSLKTFSRVKLCSDACKIESSFYFLHEIDNLSNNESLFKEFLPINISLLLYQDVNGSRGTTIFLDDCLYDFLDIFLEIFCNFRINPIL